MRRTQAVTASDQSSAMERRPSGRLLEAPFEIAAQIVDTIGPRSPGSIGEAKMAAFLDARLRQAGFRVSAESYRAFRFPGYDGIVVGTLAVIGVVGFHWMPLLSILMFAVSSGAAFLTLLSNIPLLTPRILSQNVVATRAAAGDMRWRLVVLAPLSSPPAIGRWLAEAGAGRTGRIGRTAAAVLLLGLGIAAIAPFLFHLHLWLWYAQAVPAIILFAQGIAAFIVQRAPATPGAISYAGALATLIGSAARLPHLQHTEVWMIGIGAGDSTAGINDLLRRYPFEPQHTFFISLNGIGSGTLCYLAAEGALRPRPADSLLVRLAARVVESGQTTARSCVCRCATHASVLRRRGWRAMGIAALDVKQHVPYQYERHDDLSKLDAAHLNNAVRLVVGLARALDATL
ncbi:MAG: hypothetical protein NZ699_09500 [Roseiflexus sp.]|nr:hypothetical protein [Roseiflexus sp.]MDW8233674.1 hypothetical protein [Roseiflexaceae bacterium]